MWIVKLALRSPYTFLSLAAGLVIVGIIVLIRIPTDVLPDINVPVVSVIWAIPDFQGRKCKTELARPQSALTRPM
jgi:multidrug efflux pump subunit AcrB